MKKAILEEKSFSKKIANFLSLSFSLFSVFAATLAWFTANKTVTGSNPTVSAAKNDLHCEYEVYMYDPDTGNGIDRDAEGNKFDIFSGDFEFLPYDSIFLSHNVLNPVLVRILVTGTVISHVESGSISLNIYRDNKPVYQTITDEETGETSDELLPYFTSGMKFKFAAGTTSNDIPYNNATPDSILKGADSYFRPDEVESKVFTYKEDEEWKKSNSIFFSETFTQADLVQFDKPTLIAYLYIDYDRELAENFSKASLSGSGDITSILHSGTTTNLTNDLDLLEVVFSGAEE